MGPMLFHYFPDDLPSVGRVDTTTNCFYVYGFQFPDGVLGLRHVPEARRVDPGPHALSQ